MSIEATDRETVTFTRDEFLTLLAVVSEVRQGVRFRHITDVGKAVIAKAKLVVALNDEGAVDVRLNLWDGS